MEPASQARFDEVAEFYRTEVSRPDTKGNAVYLGRVKENYDYTVERMSGAWVPTGELRYSALWQRTTVELAEGSTEAHAWGPYRSGDWIQWRFVFPAQALILLLGGGLLTFVVRRDRRHRP